MTGAGSFAGRLPRLPAGLTGFRPVRADAEPPPETTRLRLGYFPAVCAAPEFLAEELLAAEGFGEVKYVRARAVPEITSAMAAGETDFGMQTILPTVMRLDAGDPLVVVAGVHPGCYELFGTDRVHSIQDLRGKTVAVGALGAGDHADISIMAAYVGLDPRKDISWVVYPPAESKRLLAEGKVDAYMAFPPDREFVRKNPVATKRALRAILKAADICAVEPERAARFVLDKGYTRSDYALQVMKELPYGKWRQYDPADTVRFAALRLHEVG